MATGVEELLDMLYELIDEAKSVPLSSEKCIIERDKALDLLDDIKAESDEKTYILVAHNGIARVVQSYFTDMTNEEYATFGVKNCEIRRYDF